MRHWLMKSEPDVFSIADLQRVGTAFWEGVRNYQARNSMREMKVGDLVLFYHSNAEPSGIAGVARVVREAYPDPFALDPSSHYYDERAKADTWSMVDVEFVRAFPAVLSLAELKADPALAGLEVTRKGSRLSVHPVSEAHFQRVMERAGGS